MLVDCRSRLAVPDIWLALSGSYLQGGRNPVLEQPALAAIARRLNRTAGQVALRWALQHGQVRARVGAGQGAGDMACGGLDPGSSGCRRRSHFEPAIHPRPPRRP